MILSDLLLGDPANYLAHLQIALDRLGPRFLLQLPHSQVHNQTPNHCRILQNVVSLVEMRAVWVSEAAESHELGAVYMSLLSIAPRTCHDFGHQKHRGCYESCLEGAAGEVVWVLSFASTGQGVVHYDTSVAGGTCFSRDRAVGETKSDFLAEGENSACLTVVEET